MQIGFGRCQISFGGCHIGFGRCQISFGGCHIGFGRCQISFCGCQIGFCGCQIGFCVSLFTFGVDLKYTCLVEVLEGLPITSVRLKTLISKRSNILKLKYTTF